jgi:hypothetical protein
MKITMRSSGSVVVDGKTFVGNNVVIDGNKVNIDGEVQEGELVGDVNVTVHGDVESLSLSSGTVRANKAGRIQTQSGDVECGDVNGSVSTMSGSVECGNISGSVSTMSGSVKHRRG